MNIIIEQSEHEFLQQRLVQQFRIGSHLYGAAHKASDTDYLCIYRAAEVELQSGLPNVHQFQYKDVQQHTDWNYCYELQFRKNLYSGDSTINADIVLFTDHCINKLEICRTYKVIKAYLGFAKRDLKQADKPKKTLHAARGLYCAEQLLQGHLPLTENIREIYREIHDTTDLQKKEQELRMWANELYDSGKLVNYYIEHCGHSLWQKMLEANNTKEFRY